MEKLLGPVDPVDKPLGPVHKLVGVPHVSGDFVDPMAKLLSHYVGFMMTYMVD